MPVVKSRVTVPLLLLALIAPVLGMAVYCVARAYERERAEVEFHRLAAEQTDGVALGIRQGIETLYSLAAFFESSREVTREEFATFTRRVLSRHPEIHALEWAPRVAAADRKEHVARARAEGLTSYGITRRSTDGGMAPARPENPCFPVYFVEPRVGNELALGFDLASEEVRRRALDQAVETGQASMTDPILLVQEEGTSHAVLVFLPVCLPDAVTPESRRRTCTGVVLLVWRMQDLIEKMLSQGPAEAHASMRLTLLDPDGEGLPLYRFSPSKSASAPEREEGTVREELEVAGQRWHLLAAPTAAFLERTRGDRPLLLGSLVFLLAQLLYVALVVRGARSRDRMARAQMGTVRSMLRSLDEGVVVADETGRIQLVNEAAVKLVGHFGDDLERSTWSSKIGCFRSDTVTPYGLDTLPLARAMRGEHVTDEHVFIRNPQVPEGRLLRVSGAPLMGEANETRGGVVVFRDVTKQREEREHLERLSSAVEQTADAVVITDSFGLIQYVNPAFETMTGYARKEALGETPRLLRSGIHGKDFYRDLWGTVLGGEPWRGTAINRKKNGDVFYAEQTITPMEDADGQVTHFVSVFKDMTEKRRHLEQDAEIRLAGAIQQRLYPAEDPRLDGLDVAGAVFPAEATCGDYFDYIKLPDGRLGLAIGDISGHGFGPALLMAQTRASLRSLVTQHEPLDVVFGRLNETLVEDLADDMFVTLMYAQIDLGTRRLEYLNAGHPPAYVLDANGAVKEELQAHGIALGILPDREYGAAGSYTLEDGDLVVLLTDGITEARSPDGELYEEERVLEVIRAHREEPARAILDRLHESVRAFAAGRPAEDDQTMIVCKVGHRST